MGWRLNVWLVVDMHFGLLLANVLFLSVHSAWENSYLDIMNAPTVHSQLFSFLSVHSAWEKSYLGIMNAPTIQSQLFFSLSVHSVWENSYLGIMNVPTVHSQLFSLLFTRFFFCRLFTFSIPIVSSVVKTLKLGVNLYANNLSGKKCRVALQPHKLSYGFDVLRKLTATPYMSPFSSIDTNRTAYVFFSLFFY